MLTYNLSNIGSDSLYEHLYKCIKKDIVLRKIKLPSETNDGRMDRRSTSPKKLNTYESFFGAYATRAIYSIVNTLCELTEVNKIKILIDGEENKEFKDGKVKFDLLFTKQN